MLLEEKSLSIFTCRPFIFVFLVSIVIAAANQTFAGSSISASGHPAIARVSFKIVIPSSLALQVKTGSDDNILASKTIFESNAVAQSNVDDKSISVTASATLTQNSVLNVSSDILSTGNSPSSAKRAEQSHVESFPLPQLATGRYQ